MSLIYLLDNYLSRTKIAELVVRSFPFWTSCSFPFFKKNVLFCSFLFFFRVFCALWNKKERSDLFKRTKERFALVLFFFEFFVPHWPKKIFLEWLVFKKNVPFCFWIFVPHEKKKIPLFLEKNATNRWFFLKEQKRIKRTEHSFQKNGNEGKEYFVLFKRMEKNGRIECSF